MLHKSANDWRRFQQAASLRTYSNRTAAAQSCRPVRRSKNRRVR
jgi:hypothetical protein